MESSGDLKPASGNLQARTLYQAIVDRGTYVDVPIHATQCLQVAQGGESHVKIALRVDQRLQGAVLQRLFQHLLVEFGSVGEDVSMPLDQTGQEHRIAQI